jgi:hypothetical protein
MIEPLHLETTYCGAIPRLAVHRPTGDGFVAWTNEYSRLFAAAPDLLNACRYAHNFLVSRGHRGLACAIFVENAIAKAEGRVPTTPARKRLTPQINSVMPCHAGAVEPQSSQKQKAGVLNEQ